MKRLSVSTLLQAITGIMATVLVVTFAYSAERAWERWADAQKVLSVVSISRDLFQAMQNLRIERGTVNTALTAPEPAGADTQSEVAALRAQADVALQSALAKLKVAGLADVAAGINELHSNRDAVAKLRQDADAAILRPKTERPAGLSKSWVAGMGKLVDGMDALADRLSAPIDRSDPLIAELLMMKQLGWEARAAAGVDRLMVGAAIAAGDGIAADQQRQLAVLQGRVEVAWKVIGEKVHEADAPPRLRAAFEAAQQSYFTELSEKRKAIVADLVSGQKPSVSGGDWVRLSNPGLAAIMDVANVSFELTEQAAARLADAAQRDF
ncbi:MAG TPA: hypothetical protein VF502_03985, partial [Stellaceae bacterium]